MKQKLPLAVLAGLLVMLPLSGHVQSQQNLQLADDLVVVVELDSVRDDAELKRIGDTLFYETTMSHARELGEAVKAIHLPQQYTSALSVNDPLEPQAYLTLLNASTFWNTATASSQVVAVVDSGFALDHEDLTGRWYENVGEKGVTAVESSAPNCTSRSLALDKSCNNLDDDGNGFKDDWRGWDFYHNDNLPNAGSTNPGDSEAGHGTAVAGMIGATGNNNIGIASLDWGAKLMPLQIFDDEGSATTLELADAIDYAINNGADIINLSLGTSATDAVIESLLTTADNAGIIVVVAAGNCGDTSYALQGCSYQGQVTYPATNNRTIAVGATNLSDVRASFSSYGTQLDVVAPGSGAIKTTLYNQSDPDGSYSASIFGTSFASPLVAGLAAQLKEAWPSAAPKDIRAALTDTALKTSEMAGQSYTNQTGWGRIRPVEALQRVNSCKSVAWFQDVNCDNAVGLLDLSFVLSQWQVDGTGRSDINKSGKTDLFDLSSLLSKWGQ